GARDEAFFARLVTAAFGQRRKMLRNTLRGFATEGQLLAAGIVPLGTGLVGFCPLYPLIGVSTCGKKSP
ncbi:MAG TPA: YgaP-like transmembrane domain, partial [Rhodocyclaceae bacterium]|nr:YgaP-like transmembrane domain [Rhodocyclaceae bacterium]